MAFSKRKDPGAPDPDVQESAPPRPSIRERLSGMMTSLPRRSSAPQARPTTAPDLDQDVIQRPLRPRLRREDEESSSTTSDMQEEKCPYDPTEYQSFPSIEHPKCTCGLRWPWSRIKQPPLRPCTACRTGSPLSHLSTNPRFSGTRPASPVARTLEAGSQESFALPPPRPVYNVPKVLMENGPRTARMPRFPPLDSLPVPMSSFSADRPPTRRGPIPVSEQSFSFDNLKELLPTLPSKHGDGPSSLVTNSAPKLHHIHGLPHSKDYAYVRKSEVEKHLAAQRAGNPNPKLMAIQSRSQSPRTVSEADLDRPAIMRDYSGTVYYGRGASPVPITPPRPRPDPTSRPTRPARRRSPVSLDPISLIPRRVTTPHIQYGLRSPSEPQPTADLHTIEETESLTVSRDQQGDYDVELQHSRVYQVRSPGDRSTPPSPLMHDITADVLSDDESDETNFSGGTMPPTPAEIGGRRLELRGGNDEYELPRLRGGDGEEPPQRIALPRSYRLKRILLTCADCRDAQENELDDDLPPPRRAAPQRVARRVKTPFRRVPLPRHVKAWRIGVAHGGNQEIVQQNDDLSRRSTSPSTFTQSPPTPSSTSKVPCLRGGGSEDWSADERLPETLWWLAGGRRHPIRVAQWNKQKPKKRMGGLLGMAIYGHKAGMPYKNAAVEAPPPKPPVVASPEEVVDTGQETVKPEEAVPSPTAASSVRSSRSLGSAASAKSRIGSVAPGDSTSLHSSPSSSSKSSSSKGSTGGPATQGVAPATAPDHEEDKTPTRSEHENTSASPNAEPAADDIATEDIPLPASPPESEQGSTTANGHHQGEHAASNGWADISNAAAAEGSARAGRREERECLNRRCT